jgi:cardiolipin synthase A/B
VFVGGLGVDAATGWALFDVAVVLYWIGVSILLISEDREPNVTLAWLLVLFAVPFLGLVIYFFFGRNWPAIVQKSSTTMRVRAKVAAFMPSVYAPYVAETDALKAAVSGTFEGRIASLVEGKAGAPVLPVRTCDVFGSGAEYFDVLINDLASAQRFIHMNYFIWGHDELTARITAVLKDRLAAGVEVRILNDFLGCLEYSKAELNELKAAGASVGLDIRQIARVNYRNHRKITVVDAEIGHSGGFNIGQEYIDGGKKYPAWRDTGIRITGPGVADLEKLFDMRWYEVYQEDLFDPNYYPDPSLPHGEVMVQTVHHGFDERWSAATRAYQLAMSGASERIMLQSPYLVPDMTTFDVMINAAAGGVRVDFMTTAWPDKQFPWWAAESYFEPFLAAGGHIWLWEPGFMHAKSLTVDGRTASVGTLNLDMRSLRINKELMVWIYDREVVAVHERLFLDDLARCREVTLEEVRAWGRGRRFRNSAARLASNLL